MAEPHTSLSVALGAGVASIAASTVLGLSGEAVLFGFFGGLFALKVNGEGGLLARVGTVALGTMAAAAGAHPVAEWLHPEATSVAGWVKPAALVIGFGAETLLRIGLLALVNRVRQAGGLPDDRPPDERRDGAAP